MQRTAFKQQLLHLLTTPTRVMTGQLTPDGTKCYVAARIIPQEGTTLCPKGYSPDDSLGGMCARFENADQSAAACPEGARGVAGACYILVAKGPRGTATCAEGVLSGTNCVVTGAAPVNGVSTCPVSATVLADAVTGECYTLVSRVSGGEAACTAPYAIINTATMRCKVVTDGTMGFTCPAALGTILEETVTHPNGTTKIAFCIESHSNHRW